MDRWGGELGGGVRGWWKGGQEGGQETGNGTRGWRLGVGRAPGSRRTARGRRGNGDQFCQIWVHTPGAPQLDRPAERVCEEEEEEEESEPQFYIYVSLPPGQEKMYVCASISAAANGHVQTHKSVNNDGSFIQEGRWGWERVEGLGERWGGWSCFVPSAEGNLQLQG